VRTRMLGGVGRACSNVGPYPIYPPIGSVLAQVLLATIDQNESDTIANTELAISVPTRVELTEKSPGIDIADITKGSDTRPNTPRLKIK
jgi:hypothetical protein